jgi:hypothetical protein
MSTPAQFKIGELVRYTDGALTEHIARIIDIAQEEPAQYHVKVFADDGTMSQVTCGEGIHEAGAVSAL